MGEVIFPRPKEVKDYSDRPWRVDYFFHWYGPTSGAVVVSELDRSWTRYYRTRRGAIISASITYFSYVTASQWRGTATLFDNKKEQHNG